MDLKKNYISSASAQSLGRICTMGANFVVFIMAARLLGPEVFGQYSYITVFLGLAILVAEFGTNSVLATDIASVGEGASAYWGNFLILRGVLAFAVALLGIPVAWLVRPELFGCLVVGLAGLLFLVSRFFDPVFQVYEKPWYSFRGSLLYGLVFALFSLVALILHRPLIELVIVYVLANVIYTVYAYRLSQRLIRPAFRFDAAIQKKIINLAVPVGLSGIFTLIHTRADTFMLAAMKGDYAVGIYNGAYRFLDMAVILAVMLSNPLIPVFSRMVLEDREQLRRRYSSILEVLTVVIVPAALIVPLVSVPVVSLLFDSGFEEVAPLLNMMAWIGVLSFYSLFNFVALLAVKEVRFQIWLGAVTAVLNVLLNYYLIPSYGFYGSAWATLLVECVFVAVSSFYIYKTLGFSFDWPVLGRIAAVCVPLFGITVVTNGMPDALRIVMALCCWGGVVMLFGKTYKKMMGR